MKPVTNFYEHFTVYNMNFKTCSCSFHTSMSDTFFKLGFYDTSLQMSKAILWTGLTDYMGLLSRSSVFGATSQNNQLKAMKG